MLIEGPFTIQLIENIETSEREIHIKFTQEFQHLETQEQCQVLDTHIGKLESLIADTEPSSVDYQGMTIMLQFSQSIRPEIAEERIPLEETIVIEIEQVNPIASFLNEGSVH